MGRWQVHVEGDGPFKTKLPPSTFDESESAQRKKRENDIDVLFSEFVDRVRAAGHTIHNVSCVHEDGDNLLIIYSPAPKELTYLTGANQP
jgi:hypothetical protein